MRAASISGWKAGGNVAGITKSEDIFPEDSWGDFDVDDDFFYSDVDEKVDSHFEEHSQREANYLLTFVTGLYDEWSNGTKEENGHKRPLTQQEIITGVREGMQKKNPVYSNIAAQMGVVWAFNQGLKQRYAIIGYTKVRWWATFDERGPCPYCESLHLQVVDIQENFVEAGGDITGLKLDAEGAINEVRMRIPEYMAIEHPPAHCLCRCTLFPWEEDIAVIEY